MKAIVAAALVALALAGVAAPSRAQVYGQYTTAEVVPLNGHLFGAYLEASENLVGLFSQLRLSFYPNMDFGFHGGLNRLDVATGNDLTTLRLGADTRFQVARAGPSFPLDLALGGGLGVEIADNVTALTLGPTFAASRNLAVGANGGISPYVGVGLLFSNIDSNNDQSTDFSFPLRLGAEFRLAPELRINAELQLRLQDEFNDDIAFVTGVNLPF